MDHNLRSLRLRIRETLEGHIRWVSESIKPIDKNEYFIDYWPDGTQIKVFAATSQACFIDISLQLLKARSWSSSQRWFLFTGNKLPTKFSELVTSLVYALDEDNARGKFAFSNENKEGQLTYRLGQQVWISWGLLAADILGLEIPTPSSSRPLYNKYSFEEVLRATTKRFTCENAVLKQRMFSTRRTPFETRFLFHSRDTVLFHAFDHDFSFEDNNTEKRKKKKEHETQLSRACGSVAVQRWKNLIEAQPRHMEQPDMDWERTPWYALTIIMSLQKKRLHKWAPERAFDQASKVLFNASSPNGLIPGLLDIAQQPTVLQDERDEEDYWYPTFEIPFILWNYAKHSLEVHTGPSESLVNEPAPESVTKDGIKPGLQSSKTIEFSIFGKLVDQKALVEVSDDWLHNEPAALVFGHSPDERTQVCVSGHEQDTQNVGLVIDVGKGSEGTEIKNRVLTTPADILEALKKPRTASRSKKRIVWLPNCNIGVAPKFNVVPAACLGASTTNEQEALTDFFKRHVAYEKFCFDSTSSALNHWETEFHLSFFQLDKELSKGLAKEIPEGKAGPESIELKDAKSGATIRLSRISKSFRFVGDFFDRYWTCHFLENGYCPQDDGRDDERNGGKLDSNSQQGKGNTLEERLFELGYITGDNPHTNEAKETKKRKQARIFTRPWQQRKILELLILQEILQELEASADDIWKHTRESILMVRSSESKSTESRQSGNSLDRRGIKPITIGRLEFRSSNTEGPFAKALSEGVEFMRLGDHESYMSLVQRWRFYEQFLQALEDDLAASLATIEEWRRRERNRELERPRWTRDDEETFGHAITKLVALNNHFIQDIEHLQASIKAFRDSLNARLITIRDDMSFDTAGNLAVFTYVTVVFLPLSFATGIFSMNQAPGGVTLASMIITAIIALSITVIALANSKPLDVALVAPLIDRARKLGKPLVVLLLIVLYGARFILLPIRLVISFIRNFVFRRNPDPLDEDDMVKRWKKRLAKIDQQLDPRNRRSVDEQPKTSSSGPSTRGSMNTTSNTATLSESLARGNPPQSSFKPTPSQLENGAAATPHADSTD